METCDVFRSWLAAEGDGTPPPAHAAHLAACPRCRLLADAYRQAVLEGRARSARDLPDLSSFREVLERVDGPVRPRVLSWAAAAAVVAATLGGVVAWRVGAVDDGALLPGPLPSTASGTAQSGPVASTGPVPDGAPVVASAGGRDLDDPAIASLRLGPFARIRTEAWSPERSVVFLDTGTLTAAVVPRVPGSVFEVRTEFAVVEVVGTRFTVTHRPGIDTDVSCEEGRVRVRAPGRDEGGVLAAGESLRLGPGLPVAFAGPRPRSPTIGTLPVARSAAVPVPVPRVAPPAAPPAPALAPRVDPSVALARARTLLGEGRAAEAISLLEAVLPDAGPVRGRVRALLGDAQRVAGQLEPARVSYLQALAEGASEGVTVDLALLLRMQLGRPAEAADVWRRYLESNPGGRYAGQALWELATWAESQGDAAGARASWRRLVDEHPESVHAVRALVEGGRHLADAGDLDGAAVWYQARLGSRRPDLAEAALAGLIGVRSRQGRVPDLAPLVADYERRFPAGVHRDEVRRVLGPTGADR